MRALEFKIYPDKLTTKDWSHWKRADAHHILSVATDNNVTCVEDGVGYDTMVFKGTPENLFHFMYDVAYRYDIEII